tara:strand:+ start:4555 stop:4734 length:180 start_codon:yes stop_codon:yes gene_type:complete
MSKDRYVMIHNIDHKIICRKITEEEYINLKITTSGDEIVLAVYDKQEYLDFIKNAIKII